MNVPLPDPAILLNTLAEAIRPRLTPDTALVGIHTGGVWVAQWLHKALGIKTPLGMLDISFYRDDFSQRGLHPEVKPTQLPFNVEDHPIILVDDVLYTGRTIRAAMNELFDYGRPGTIYLAALLDRDGRQLPIHADFIGAKIELPAGKNIQLKQDEQGNLILLVQ
jgi:pyrimidine operon attenuation protein / uracil phosphoribosyltransferase